MKCRKAWVLLLNGLFAFAASGLASNVAKSAWQWSDEDRVAARFDKSNIAARNARAAQRGLTPNGTSPQSATNTTSTSYVLDGKEYPELFLPFELFEMLAGGMSPDAALRQRARDFYNPKLTEAGYDAAEFWVTLDASSREYVSVASRRPGQREYSETRPAEGSEQPLNGHASAFVSLCRSRYDALNEARARFGVSGFDRLLYTVVAPYVVKASATTDPNAAKELLYQANGCR